MSPEPSRYAIDHALTEALIRREYLKRDDLAMTEAIANYHTEIAATANQLRCIINQVQFYPDMRTEETGRVITMLRQQITNHYFHKFGVMPSWQEA